MTQVGHANPACTGLLMRWAFATRECQVEIAVSLDSCVAEPQSPGLRFGSFIVDNDEGLNFRAGITSSPWTNRVQAGDHSTHAQPHPLPQHQSPLPPTGSCTPPPYPPPPLSKTLLPHYHPYPTTTVYHPVHTTYPTPQPCPYPARCSGPISKPRPRIAADQAPSALTPTPPTPQPRATPVSSTSALTAT